MCGYYRLLDDSLKTEADVFPCVKHLSGEEYLQVREVVSACDNCKQMQVRRVS